MRPLCAVALRALLALCERLSVQHLDKGSRPLTRIGRLAFFVCLASLNSLFPSHDVIFQFYFSLLCCVQFANYGRDN